MFSEPTASIQGGWGWVVVLVGSIVHLLVNGTQVFHQRRSPIVNTRTPGGGGNSGDKLWNSTHGGEEAASGYIYLNRWVGLETVSCKLKGKCILSKCW